MRLHQRLLLTGLLLFPAGLRGQDAPPVARGPEGVEVLARGPVHEAFAQPPDVGRPEGGPVAPKEPPPAVEELPPEPDASFYTPGSWVLRETRYVWRPGCWVRYQPGWVWVPCHYAWTPAGCVFVEGYWDYPLHRRGLLFAPVCFDQSFRGPWTPR